jgi:transglutaminase/protease-like cytokinesis protein 3
MNWYLVVGSWLVGLYMAQAQPFTTLDHHAQTIPLDGSDNLHALVKKLTAPARSELEKTRVLFVWTATNIQYDDSQMKPYQYGFAQKSVDTLAVATRIMRQKRGVCTDYSLLLYQLLRTAGLPARIVSGYAKGHPDQAGTPIRSINHQWNAVFLDGRWQHLDATWASTNNGTRPLNMYYFLTPPNQFIANHFPTNPADQQVEKPLTKTEFDTLPRVYDDYFTLGFGPDFPRKGLFQIKQKLQLSVNNPAKMEFAVLAHRYGQPKNERTFYYRAFRQKAGYDLAMQVLRDGVYSVHILSRPKGNTDDFQLILTLTVISSR